MTSNVFTNLNVSTAPSILIAGPPITGKTTAVAGAANAGYQTFILSSAANIKVLQAHLTPDGIDNVKSVVCRFDELRHKAYVPDTGNDAYKGLAGHTVIDTKDGARPTAWDSIDALTERWVDPHQKDVKFEPYPQWDANRLIVVDELTSFAESPTSPARIKALWQCKLLGKPIPQNMSQRLVGTAQNLIMQWIGTMLQMKRRFPVIIMAHTRRLNINPDNFMSDHELAEELNKTDDEKAKSNKYGQLKKSAMEFPLVCGEAPSRTVAGKFDIVIATSRDEADGQLYGYLAYPPDYPNTLEVRTPFPPNAFVFDEKKKDGIKWRMPVANLIPYVLEQHKKYT